MSLEGKTLFITGASRGIGLAIAIKAAHDGANIVIAAKTDTPHPKLPGTIHTAAKAIEEAGGKALPLVVDVRDEASVTQAFERASQHFGSIDIVINNASAIHLADTSHVGMKRFDLMHQVNTRGTFLVSKIALPYLEKADNPHILMLSPPLDMKEKWFAPHLAYSLAKYGMSLCVLGLAGELREKGIAVNALWPRTTIATSAVNNLLGGEALMRASRTPEIVADAAYVMLNQPAKDYTGRFDLDEDVLRHAGVTDFEPLPR
jgi:citronellol/citronellal dehydrogenase